MFSLEKIIKITTLTSQKVYQLDKSDYSFKEVENEFWPKNITVDTHSVRLRKRSDDVFFQALELEEMFILFKLGEWFLEKDGSLVEKVEDIVYI